MDPPEGLMWQERKLQVSEGTSSIDNENHHIELGGEILETLTYHREPIGEGLSVLDEDHFDINSVANVFEGPRMKCATNVSAPNDGDGSSRCRTSWCGGVRGVLANLQKRAAECSMIACPGLTKTRFWKDLPCNGGTPNRRWWQAWCLCCKRSTEVSAYGRNEKGAPRSIAPVSRRHAHVTSSWSASLGFVLEAPVLVRSTRRSGTTCNLVSMHIDDVLSTSPGLLRKKWSLRQMETSDAHGNLFHSKGDRLHMCFTKWHALKLVKNDMLLMLDIELGYSPVSQRVI